MPEVSEKLGDIRAAMLTHVRRCNLHQEAYLKQRMLFFEKLAIIFPHLPPDYLRELRTSIEKERDMLHEWGEIITLIGQDNLEFIDEVQQCLKS